MTSEKRTRLICLVLLAALLGWGIICAATLWSSAATGSDFSVFYTASRATATGALPYDWTIQSSWEHRLLLAVSPVLPLHKYTGPSFGSAFGNPPPFASLLIPLTQHADLHTAFQIWSLLAFLVTIGGLAALLHWMGYHYNWLLAPVLAMAPSSTFDLFLGQTSWVLFAGLVCGVVLAETTPVLASASMILLGFPKPHLLLPLILVVLLAFPRQRRHLAYGVAAGFGVWLLLALWLGGPLALGAWVRDLLQFRATISGQPDLASLAGLYTRVVPDAVLTVIDGLLVVGGVAILCICRPRREDVAQRSRSFLTMGIPLVLAIVPYAHSHDGMVLAVPLLLLIGLDLRGLTRPLVLAAVIMSLLVPLVMWMDHSFPLLSSLPALCVLAAGYVDSPWLRRFPSSLPQWATP